MSKDFKYFIFEFLVIMLSLLATFYLEELRESYKREQKKTEILNSIMSDIEEEREGLNYTDSIFSRKLLIIDSILENQNPSEKSIADLIKIEVQFTEQSFEPIHLHDWSELINSEDVEMTKIRNLIEVDGLTMFLATYLINLRNHSNFNYPRIDELVATLSKEVFLDINTSWRIDNENFRNTGNSYGDLVMGDFEYQADYHVLAKKETFKQAITNLSIHIREKRRNIIYLHLLLDYLEDMVKKEVS